MNISNEGVLVLLEESHADELLFRKAVLELRPNFRVYVIHNIGSVLSVLKALPNVQCLIVAAEWHGSDRYSIIKQIRADEALKETNIILFSGSGSSLETRLAKEAQVDLYMKKPVDLSDYFNCVEQIIDLCVAPV